MSKKSFDLLGLMRKAGAIEIGEANAGAACKDGKARLLILASDASDNACRRAEQFVSGRRTLLIKVPFSKEEISDKTGKPGCSMAAITDLGFANAFAKDLSETEPGLYAEAAKSLGARYGKALRRKKSTAVEKKKRQGKREE